MDFEVIMTTDTYILCQQRRAQANLLLQRLLAEKKHGGSIGKEKAG